MAVILKRLLYSRRKESHKMYGLPPDFDIKIFVGRNLELICFNENQIALHFNDDLSIVIESAFSHQSESSSKTQVAEIPVLESDLMQLLGRTITEGSGDKNGTLTLKFDNGHILNVFDTSSQYESYQIKYRGNVMII